MVRILKRCLYWNVTLITLLMYTAFFAPGRCMCIGVCSHVSWCPSITQVQVTGRMTSCTFRATIAVAIALHTRPVQQRAVVGFPIPVTDLSSCNNSVCMWCSFRLQQPGGWYAENSKKSDHSYDPDGKQAFAAHEPSRSGEALPHRCPLRTAPLESHVQVMHLFRPLEHTSQEHVACRQTRRWQPCATAVMRRRWHGPSRTQSTETKAQTGATRSAQSWGRCPPGPRRPRHLWLRPTSSPQARVQGPASSRQGLPARRPCRLRPSAFSQPLRSSSNLPSPQSRHPLAQDPMPRTLRLRAHRSSGSCPGQLLQIL